MPTLEELKQQEAELEAQMLGNQETEVTSATEEGVEQSEDEQQAAEWMEEHIVPDPPAPPEEIEDIELQPQPEKKPRNDWKNLSREIACFISRDKQKQACGNTN